MVTKEMSKHMPTVHQSPEMVQLRDYVTADDSTRYDNMAEGNLRLDVTHSNLIQRWHDILFSEDMTIDDVKNKLYRHGGTPGRWQELYLKRGSDTIFLMDDTKTLRYYGAKSGMEIHIKDLDPHSMSKHGGLEDVSQVEKYVMPDEEYDKMANTVRAKKREEAAKRKAEAEARGEAEGQELAAEDSTCNSQPQDLTPEEAEAAYPLGGRCECDPGSRRGAICFVGPVDGTKGLWIGIRLDEPQGQNDGTKDGKRYFECPGPKYGCFCKPQNVRVGDYPERDPFASDDEF